MRIIESSVELVNAPSYENLLSAIELAGRTCYKSEDKITTDSAEQFVRNIIKCGHEAVLEHGVLTIRFICDRGVSHEIVRHRLAAYCQESTRYCNYSKDKFNAEITVIKPVAIRDGTDTYNYWLTGCAMAENAYFQLLSFGSSPQTARAVLPTCLKTELIMTTNIREIRHFLRLRCAANAHPDIRVLARMLLINLKCLYPALFEDINP